MDVILFSKEVIKTIDGYIMGSITNKEASDWAFGAIKTYDLESLPQYLVHAIHMIADLHDQNKSWCPSKEELQKCKTELEEGIKDEK